MTTPERLAEIEARQAELAERIELLTRAVKVLLDRPYQHAISPEEAAATDRLKATL